MGIVKRIQNANASYETEKWDRSRRDHQQVLGRISRFRPRQSFKPASLAPRRLEPLQHSTSAFSCLAPQDAQQNPYLPTLEAAAQFEYDLTQIQQGRPGQGESGLLDEYLMAPQEGQPPRAAADDGGAPGRSGGAVRVHINANDETAAPGLQVPSRPPHRARPSPCIRVRAPSIRKRAALTIIDGVLVALTALRLPRGRSRSTLPRRAVAPFAKRICCIYGPCCTIHKPFQRQRAAQAVVIL